MQVDFSAFEERMLGKGFGKVLGAKLVHVEDGLCKIRLDYRPELSRGDELIHGGVIAALIDKAASPARTIVESGRGITRDFPVRARFARKRSTASTFLYICADRTMQ